jgi:hypothetical protein
MSGKRSPFERAGRRDQVKTKRAAENKIYWRRLLSGRTLERVRDDFDCRLQCLEPPLAIASMRPLARMAENVALDILFDSG